MTTEIEAGDQAIDYAFADFLPELFFAFSGDGRPLYFNKSWCDYTGLVRRDVLDPAEDWTFFLHPDDSDRCRDAWRDSLKHESVLEIECRLRSGDGLHRWFLGRAVPRPASSGTIGSWFGTCTDIDELRRGRERLQRVDLRFRSLVDAPSQTIWTSDPDGFVIFASEGWSQITGAPLEKSQGWGWLNFVHSDDRARVEQLWRTAILQRTPLDLDLRVRRDEEASGRRLVLRACPVMDDQGDVCEWVGVFSDVEDLLTRVTTERTVELKRSNENLESFAVAAAHDLQEPLRKIQAFGSRLSARAESVLDAQGKDYLNRIITAAERMRTLINNILACSRVTSLVRPFVPVDLGAIAREVVSDLAPAIDRSGGRVELGPLPTIQADPVLMHRLLQNLIGNALKFHHPDRPPTVLIRCQEGAVAGECILEVTDDGVGFDEVHRERIFQLFQRLHGRNEYEGSGIGLAICRQIVEHHSGTIEATSRVGVGSTFRVVLPAARLP